jgi:hypothetical protein
VTVEIGDVVVTMSYPGIFTVVDIKGEDVTIAAANGTPKVVRLANLRRLNRPPQTES